VAATDTGPDLLTLEITATVFINDPRRARIVLSIFTGDLMRDAASHAIVTKVIELAHTLDLSVVTEGMRGPFRPTASTI